MKTLTVGKLKETLSELGLLDDDLPIVIAGSSLKVTGAQVVYQARFEVLDFCGVDEEDRRPIAVMLQVVTA